jgi:hypothetical protein
MSTRREFIALLTYRYETSRSAVPAGSPADQW